ncbi:MAG: ankyrin repeat domain-containing protein [Candidatus Eisenbacteria bacterium]|uniref:Ankyrin repeat domain-containing protein n=1 Tax=Eiseniibacteriota bacterium TaxID=2212470 RepID=A0A956NHV5_UNCEI|nr:ankyrin repeat domain-containing protein [Candidatus Eisenbacteria bacterium]
MKGAFLLAFLAFLLLLGWGVAPGGAEIPSEWITAMVEGDLVALDSLLVEANGQFPVDVQGQTLLHLASRYGSGDGNTALLAHLVDSGIPVSAPDLHGITPLHTAASNDCVPCVARLLELGAKVDARRHDGQTPLFHAGPDAQLALIAAGAEVAARDRSGAIPLHVNRRPTEPLLEPGVNVTDAAGMTALHRAALEGDADRIEWLLARGADPRIRTSAPYDFREGVLAPEFDPVLRIDAGKTAYDIAKWQHNRNKWSTGRFSRAKDLLEESRRKRR